MMKLSWGQSFVDLLRSWWMAMACRNTAPDGIAPGAFGGKYISMAKMSGDFPRITSSVPLFWCASWGSARLPAAVLHEVSHAVDRARGRAHCSLALALLATEGRQWGKVHRLGFLSPVGNGTAAVVPQAVRTVSGVSIALPKT